MLKKSMILISLAMLGQVACGSLISIKGPSIGGSCDEGEINQGGNTGGVKIWPFVDIQGPGVNKCVSASSLSITEGDESDEDQDEFQDVNEEEQIQEVAANDDMDE